LGFAGGGSGGGFGADLEEREYGRVAAVVVPVEVAEEGSYVWMHCPLSSVTMALLLSPHLSCQPPGFWGAGGGAG